MPVWEQFATDQTDRWQVVPRQTDRYLLSMTAY